MQQEHIMHDFRFAFRALRQNPGFALTAIVSIGLAVGVGATVFGTEDALLFRPLPVPHSSQILTLSARTPSGVSGAISYPDFRDFQRLNHSFNGLAATRITLLGFAKDQKDQPRMQAGFLASGNLFEVLGVYPFLGRGFRPQEDQAPGRDAVAILGYEFWRHDLAADPSIIGKHVLLNGLDFTVIGVTPEFFTGLDQFFHPALYVPLMMAPALAKADAGLLSDRAERVLNVKGRIKPGVSLTEANAEAASLAHALAQLFPATNKGFGAGVRTELRARLDMQTGDTLLAGFLFSLVAIVVLVACANVANLMLGRGSARTRELAIRVAIGASRGRLVRSVLAESTLIAMAGSVLGLIIAQAGIDLVSTVTMPGDVPMTLNVQLDQRVLFFTLALSLLSVFLFGLVPALRLTRGDLVPALKTGELDPTRQRLLGRGALVIAQIAGSLLLMVLATQSFRGASYVLSHDPGFQTRNRLLMGFNPTIIGYTPQQTAAFYQQLVERVRNVPTVKSAALAHFLPTSTNYEQETASPEGYHFPAGQHGVTLPAATVGEDYFSTIATPLVAGRAFLPADDAHAPLVVIVNQFFVDHYALKNPLGQRLLLGEKNPRWAQIVGVAATGKYLSVFEPPQDFIYRPMKQHAVPAMTLIVETLGNPASMADPLRQVVRSISPNMPVFSVRTLEDLYDQRSVNVANVFLSLVGSIAVIGLSLALVGLYAVVAYQVSRQTREIGIRMAIGAGKSQILQMVLRQAAVLGVSGVAIGLALSVAASHQLSAAVHASFDPILLAVVVAGLLLVTLGAALIPARRAALIDPLRAMRQD